MAQVTKITFSKRELDVLNNSDFFVQKHIVTKKVVDLFSDLERELEENISDYSYLNGFTNTSTGKIFKGENYRQLPYVVLDYPKHFSTDSVFTYRTMFWWGNEFSFTLHLQGHALDHFRKTLLNNVNILKKKNVFVCINTKQWDYHFNNDNYQPLDELLKTETLFEKIKDKNFIKLSRKISLAKYKNLTKYGMETFELFMNAIE